MNENSDITIKGIMVLMFIAFIIGIPFGILAAFLYFLKLCIFNF